MKRESALEGLRVLDLSRVLAGPWCGQILADLGADVIKVERPQTGDDTRRWEPSFERDGERHSSYFLAVNRGKRSITVNLATPEGSALIRDLARQSDVLIENFKVGDLDRQGLGYSDLSKVNPRLVYCSITGFGQTGPLRTKAGYDTILQAMGGLMSITGNPDGEPGGGPQRCGLPVIDMMTGVYSALAILAAIHRREQTGKGQHIDMSLLDVQVSSLAYYGLDYALNGRVQGRTGNANPVSHPSGPYRCADGRIVILVGNDDQFRRFCGALGRADMLEDARFAASRDRVANNHALDDAIEDALAARSVADWLEILEKAGVPCGPIQDIAAVMAHPQVIARSACTSIEHAQLGTIPLMASPLRLSDTPPAYRLPPPMLGEHTAQVLKEMLGMADGQVEEFRQRGIV
jgi:crotonobetainyl-CoA:carnitine CoA-transferase CaiB-like acyl-CoA transferase